MRALSSLEWLVIFIIVVGALAVVVGTFQNVWSPLQGSAADASTNLLGNLSKMG